MNTNAAGPAISTRSIGAVALTDEQLREFHEVGYVRLGRVASDDEIAAMCQRIDDIMLGKMRYPSMGMQLCPSSKLNSDQKGVFSKGWKGATLEYRKIQDLELDPLFRAFMQKSLFRDLTQKLIGEQIAVFRAMFFNKPANGGVRLGWHQDGASYADPKSAWNLTIAPQVTVWTALDPATIANGCIQIVPGTHRRLMSARGVDVVTPDEFQAQCGDKEVISVELKRGEAALFHNWTLHRSEPNSTNQARRAFSVCYIDAASRQLTSGNDFPQIFPVYQPASAKALVDVSY